MDQCLNHPGVPTNGRTVVNSTTVGSVAFHSCDEGYVLDGTDRRVCLSNGSWSKTLPSCNRKCHLTVNITRYIK